LTSTFYMSHTPVLLEEVIKYLDPKPDENFIDGTLGEGGHSKEILKRTSPAGKLLGIDQDGEAIKIAGENLKEFRERVLLVQDNFANLKNIFAEHGEKIGKVKGVLLDLGFSSSQIEKSGRGFSFERDEPLIMTLCWPIAPGQITAADIVNSYPEKELEKIFKEYGEERLARVIAQRIVLRRKSEKILRTSQLSEIAAGAYKKFYGNKTWRTRPATKIFMALRIAVNSELENLEKALPQALEILPRGGKLAAVSFQSLEDRIVKIFFRRESRDCVCEKILLECACRHQKTLKIITKKPIIPSLEEIEKNPKARSAKLRVAEKI